MRPSAVTDTVLLLLKGTLTPLSITPDCCSVPSSAIDTFSFSTFEWSPPSARVISAFND